jgi:hypothetical protein
MKMKGINPGKLHGAGKDSRPRKPGRSIAELASTCLMIALAGCGGSGSSGSASSTLLQQRTDAATTTASSNTACTSITPFYWEIGDASGLLASGTGGDNSAGPPDSGTLMLIASASKWIFSTYVVEKQNGVLSASDIKYLNFESGYTNFSSCSTASTVSSCLGEAGTNGGTNGDYISGTDGKFFYNGGHMQVLANALGLGTDNNAALATDIKSIIGANVALAYIQPQLAGGGLTTPANYAQFLRNLLAGNYSHMLGLLGSNAVCAHANSTDCPSAIYSPVNQSAPGVLSNDISDEAWHYSLGHWVEDDPSTGDGAFSSPGAFGFYPWIDQSKTYYGILARFDAVHASAGVASTFCGRLIRKAWTLGQAQ